MELEEEVDLQCFASSQAMHSWTGTGLGMISGGNTGAGVCIVGVWVWVPSNSSPLTSSITIKFSLYTYGVQAKVCVLDTSLDTCRPDSNLGVEKALAKKSIHWSTLVISDCYRIRTEQAWTISIVTHVLTVISCGAPPCTFQGWQLPSWINWAQVLGQVPIMYLSKVFSLAVPTAYLQTRNPYWDSNAHILASVLDDSFIIHDGFCRKQVSMCVKMGRDWRS